MANYANLKDHIDDVIKTNGIQGITGAKLQAELFRMIDSLGAGFQFIDIATPATNPGTPDQNVFYIASEAGTYTNFGGLVVNAGEVAVLKYNGSWSKKATGAATAEQVSALGHKVGDAVSEIYTAGTTGNISRDFSLLNFVGETIKITVIDPNDAYGYYNVYGIKNGALTSLGTIGASKTPITAVLDKVYDSFRVYSSNNKGHGGDIDIRIEVVDSIAEDVADLQRKTASAEANIGTNAANITDINFNLYGVSNSSSYNATSGSAIPIVNGLYTTGKIPAGYAFDVLINDPDGAINYAGYSCFGFDKDGQQININSYDTQYEGIVPNRKSTYICPFDVYAVGVYITGTAVVGSGVVSLILTASGKISSEIDSLHAKDDLIEGEISGMRDSIGAISPAQDDSLGSRRYLKDNAAYYFNIPASLTSYDTDNYFDQRIKATPFGKQFLFFTDTHQQNTQNCKLSEVVEYIKKRIAVKTSIFGGDCIDAYPGQYEALANVGSFASEYFSASGRGFLWVEGNHDANSPGHNDNVTVGNNYLINDYYGYLRTTRGLTGRVKFYDEAAEYGPSFLTDANIATFISDYTTALGSFYSNDYTGPQFDGALVQQLFSAWCRKNYYYDDQANCIRFLVLETRDFGMMARMLSYTSTYILADFIAEAINTIPAGFSLMVIGHQWGADNGQSPLRNGNNDLANFVYQMLLAYKAGGSFTFTPYLGTYYLGAKWWQAKYGAVTSKTYDFSAANPADKIMVLGGHYHIDAAWKIYHSSGTTLAAQEIDTGASIGASEILVVWTHKATYNASAGNPSDWGLTYAEAYSMTNGTITEYAFDIATILSDRIRFTRYGAGNDREYLL